MRAFYYGVAYLKLARVSRCSGEITAKPVKSAATIVERQPYFGSARGLSCGVSNVDGSVIPNKGQSSQKNANATYTF
mgnify:FL=1